MTMDAQMLTANWSYPTQVRFGPGRIGELPEACRSVGMGRPLLVTDPGVAALAMVGDAVAACREAGLAVEVFSDVKPNPVGKNVDEGVRVFREGGHDGVIAFGGGSGLDAGKGIAFMAGQTRPIWDFEDVGDNWTRADAGAIAPIVAVPTTAGTGSEVGRAGVFLNEDTGTKVIVFHPKMLPSVVVSDPELTLGLPPHITAATGMDALAHCLEAYCATGLHPMAEGIAVEGMRLIKNWLPAAVADGRNLAARAYMMAAASMGAVAFQKGLGAIHSLSHPVGALYDTHHGLTNAVFMPYVLVFNRPAIEDKLIRLAAWLELPNPSFRSFVDWVVALRREIGIPHTLAELGVGRDRIERIAEMAAVDPTAGSNPVPLTLANLKDVLLASFDGTL
jgi:hypothetical protein